ncbi:hypothetical protein [Streptomyces xanthophaeus]|uniref:hypothetical protein n=1 Tax=Streptomyces xanthophaeus TaxID=67385 RepID=UPI003719199F
MPTEPPKDDLPARPADLERARLWLAGHRLSDVPPTALLGLRLAARQSSRLAGHVLLAVFIVVAALIYALNRPAGDTAGAADPSRYGSLLLLAAVVTALVLAQALLDRRVRRIDRQAGTALPRRAARPVRLGWRTVIGLPRAALAVATFAAATALALGALTVGEPGARYAGAVLLIGLCGAAAVMLVQLRHVLTHPAVADDEASLTADALMRIEDAREIAAPTVVWCLPTASVVEAHPGWWNIAWFGFIALGAVTLALITLWTATSGTAARTAAAGG